MLALFPNILFLAPLSILAFRLALTATLVYSAWKHLSGIPDPISRSVGALEILVAVGIGVGAWTQLAGVAASLLLITEIALPRLRVVALGTALLALVIALSLIITGPGFFSFDLPL